MIVYGSEKEGERNRTVIYGVLVPWTGCMPTSELGIIE